MATTPDNPTPMHLRLIPAFVGSIKSVLSTMAGVQVTILPPHLKAETAPPQDVSGVIGFSGTLAGSVVLCFPNATAVKLVGAFAGAEHPSGSPDFADAIGELTNMIAGAAKSNLGPGATITTPVVIIGAGHSVPRLRDLPCLVIPCRCPQGDFAVELNVRQQAQQAAA
ncbi:MAG: CheC domain protein [Phycisphaerales bacterium]|nr:CheC domain protein [Phycisphaerales bacterium]